MILQPSAPRIFHGCLFPHPILSSNSFLEKNVCGGRREARRGLCARENVIFEEHTLRKIHVLDAPGAGPNYHQCFVRIESSLPEFHAVRINGSPSPHLFVRLETLYFSLSVLCSVSPRMLGWVALWIWKVKNFARTTWIKIFHRNLANNFRIGHHFYFVSPTPFDSRRMFAGEILSCQ